MTRLLRAQSLGAVCDEPLLSIQPLLDMGKADASPALIQEKLRFQLGVKVMSHGSGSEELRILLISTNSFL